LESVPSLAQKRPFAQKLGRLHKNVASQQIAWRAEMCFQERSSRSN